MYQNEEQIIEDILDEFDFAKAQEVMECLQWVWHDAEHGVPTIGQMRKQARYLMKSCIGHHTFTTATGGLHVHKETYSEKPYYRLQFVVTEWNNYE
jgi:hypothetical protein